MNDWISVNDWLPKLDHYIDGGDPTWAAPYVLGYHRGSTPAEKITYCDPNTGRWYDTRGVELTRISHWMPLPTTPEEEPGQARPPR